MIPQLSVADLKAKLDSGEDFLLLDVREEDEYAISKIERAKLFPLSTFGEKWENELSEFKDKEVIIHCKMGGRSQRACEFLESQGFTNLANVAGGITAWADEIDPTTPKY